MFSEQFAFSLPARVNFVGGGGKTGLILRLLEEYSATVPALYITTTRIHPPHPFGGLAILSSDNEAYLERLLDRAILSWSSGRRFVATHLLRSPDLLSGVTPGFADRMDRDLFPLLLNEADGARSMSLKLPREGEPVLIPNANYLVPVIGLDCLNQPLGPRTLFRWELASKRYRLSRGQMLTPELAASILFHPHGVCKDWKPGMRVIPFINKADSQSDDPLALSLARALLHNGEFQVDHVVWGSLLKDRVTSFAG